MRLRKRAASPGVERTRDAGTPAENGCDGGVGLAAMAFATDVQSLGFQRKARLGRHLCFKR